MVDVDIKKVLLSSIPSTITIDGNTFTIKKTLGSIPLNKLELPTINIKFINEDDLYYRSIDDCYSVDIDNNPHFCNTNSCTIRYTVAATDANINTSENIVYKTGVNIYPLTRVPSIDITQIGSYIKNTDYKLTSDHTSVEWIGNKPSNNTTFNVKYKWVNSGYYISNQLIIYLLKDFKGHVFNLLKDYGINVLDHRGIKDNSDIYISDSFNVFSFDIAITYPFRWDVTVSEEDAITANTFTFDLILNDINIDTISTNRMI